MAVQRESASSSAPIRWLVVHTKPKAEEQALAELLNQGYQAYLPRLAIRRPRRGRATTRVEPLFPRYLFVAGGTPDAPIEQRPIGYTKGVARIVRFGLEPGYLSDEQIQAIKLEEQTRIERPAQPLRAGTPVVVTSGPLAYAPGIFDTIDGEGRARILLEILGQKVPHTIDFNRLHAA